MPIQYFVDAVTVGGIYALLAVGLAMTFGVARLVNLAQGELIMVAAYTIYLFSPDLWYLSIPIAVIVSVLFALLMSWLPFSFLRGADETTLLVASFGVSLALQGVAVAIFGSRPKGTGFGSGVSASVELFGLTVSLLDLITFVVVLLMLLLLTVFLRSTAAGVWIRASAEDFVMAQLLGVRAQRVVTISFVISGVIAALTGILLTARSGTVLPEMGVQPLLLGLVAVVLGGLRSLPGAAAGGFLLGGLTVALTVLLPAGIAVYRDAILFVIVILVLLVRPGGIFIKSNALERV
ncbi:branched-chain amino acid ABC transporter permease [Microbacterium sp.]|uniref:branched-chain amino acid ABC transporter permease n=1 Tax=Microbacterium sp. TaxID=51671 RepID=UPI003A8F9E81